MPIFSVVDMDENAFTAAYPLVRTAAPDVSAEQWSVYAHKVRMRGGLLGLMGPQSTLFGLLTYRNEESLRHGRIFVVDNFLTFELSRAAPGRQALCDAAEALARKQLCNAIELRLDSRGFAIDHSTKARGWLDLGHSLEALVFTKILDAGPHADVGGLQYSADRGNPVTGNYCRQCASPWPATHPSSLHPGYSNVTAGCLDRGRSRGGARWSGRQLGFDQA